MFLADAVSRCSKNSLGCRVPCLVFLFLVGVVSRFLFLVVVVFHVLCFCGCCASWALFLAIVLLMSCPMFNVSCNWKLSRPMFNDHCRCCPPVVFFRAPVFVFLCLPFPMFSVSRGCRLPWSLLLVLVFSHVQSFFLL